MAKGRVVIDEVRCKGCALCTTACPPGVLTMANDQLNARGYHPVRLVDPEGHCSGCGLCAVICPDACITVYRVVSCQTSAVRGPALAGV
ncbi:MAG: 4Fe-4S binding protein [Chloroflexi bacterium]|nr:4Fe-4S binding protein [Chloroflexota bacterium]MBI3760498.1 4Fe-4S binding protein [Chloroflexota bacterium]